MFLHASVILSTGGCLPQCMLGYHHPPGADPPSRHPPEQTTRSRSPREQTPPGEQTPAYGQRAAGTHPTGMHSCLWFFSTLTMEVFGLFLNWTNLKETNIEKIFVGTREFSIKRMKSFNSAQPSTNFYGYLPLYHYDHYEWPPLSNWLLWFLWIEFGVMGQLIGFASVGVTTHKI